MSGLEARLRAWLVPKVPASVETYHLTMVTVVWCILVILFSYLARFNIHFLWLVSASILGQYITDVLDGEVGRRRGTGLIRWGYYMDHFLDYSFLCCILIGYGLMVESQNKYLLFYLLALCGAFMVNSFLAFGATGKLRKSYMGIGHTEVRFVFMLLNTLVNFSGKTVNVQKFIPFLLLIATFALIMTVYHTQKELWEIDMENKRNEDD
jgi:phosphatidylglycerophosphate synthase